MRRHARRIAHYAVLGAVVALVFALSGCGTSGTGRPGGALGAIETPPAATASTGDVLQLVATASNIKSVPANLTPPLKDPGQGSIQDAQICEATSSQVRLGPCVFGDISGKHMVVLLGDSKAFNWLPAFDAIGKRLGWQVVLLSKESCPPAYLSVGRPPIGDAVDYGPFPECDQWHDYAIARTNHMDPDLVVLMSTTYNQRTADGKPVTKDAWSAALRRTLDKLNSPNTRKAILGDTPILQQSAPDCLAANADSVQACSANKDDVESVEFQDIEAATAQAAGVAYIDTLPWFCTNVCSTIVGNMLVYKDAGDPTFAYTLFLSGALQDALAPLTGKP